jgi:hypothetical protein
MGIGNVVGMGERVVKIVPLQTPCKFTNILNRSGYPGNMMGVNLLG